MAFPKIDGYVVTEKLGSGSYSTVYKANTKHFHSELEELRKHVGAKSTVAIKCVDKSRVKHSGSAIDNLVTEIRLLKTLTHPHIVQMKEFTWDDRNIYIIMEYCCGGDLSKYIHKNGRVPEKRVLYFLQQLASALKFLREKGVVHMDLKPHNLLLHKDNGKYILKVADFGFAQHMSEETKQCVRGSPLYMAPEMLAGEYDARVDLWSVGVIMYECLFGKAPYSSNTFKELVEKIEKKAPIEIPRNSSISAGCQDLLTRLLQHEPARRISYEEFFAHPYLDLDHMPSKENYDRAVALIKQAIELDCGGRLAEAFAAYRDSLRYLVPAASAETDPVRRSALAAKLTRYMERAEEIKLYLKGADTSALVDQNQLRQGDAPRRLEPRRIAASCCAAQSLASQEYSQYGCAPCARACGQQHCSCSGGSEVNGTEEIPAHDQPAHHAATPSGAGSPRAASPGKFNLRRLFARTHSLPYLDDKEPNINEDDSKKHKTEDNSNDMCRIT